MQKNLFIKGKNHDIAPCVDKIQKKHLQIFSQVPDFAPPLGLEPKTL